jgi:hypothetical protein
VATWEVTPALLALRETFNRHCPQRDKTSDGSIGDPAHAASSSDHNPDETGNTPINDADSINEVHAIDVDVNLRQSDARGPFTMERAVQAILTDCRSGQENRLRYIIYDRRIWSASSSWREQRYTGDNPHDKHAHFSGSYTTSRERNSRPWNIGFKEEDTVSKADVIDALDDAVPWLSAGVKNEAAADGWSDKVSTRSLLEYIFAATVLRAPDRFEQILTAISSDPGNSVSLTPEQIPILAAEIATRLPSGPTAAQIADAVNDDAAARLTG